MQKLVAKYGLAAHLALAVVAPLFLSSTAVICLSLLATVWYFIEPSRFGVERLGEARRRVLHATLCDPLFWVCLALVVLAVLRMLNTGIALSYDAETRKWYLANPVFPLLPGSVEGTAGPLVGCAVCSLVVIQACRHGLGRSARGAFALVSSGLAGIGAIVWAALCHEEVGAALGALEWSLTNPVYAGSSYGIFLALSIVALTTALERHWWRAMPFVLVGIGGNLLGLFMFSPPVIAAAFAAAAVVVLAYAFVYLRLRVARTTEFKFLVFFLFGVCLAGLAAVGFLPQSALDVRIDPFMTGAFVPEGYVESRTALSEIAMRVWKASPWLGGGFGSFALNLQFNATPSDWTVIDPLQKAIQNGYWLVLAERGVVGAFSLAVPVVLLVGTYVVRMARGVVVEMPHPLAWAGLVLFVVAGMEMLVDVSFLASSASVTLAAALSLSANAFPKE